MISVANQKGGVGKTTSAINLAASLAATERHTLLIDFDPQANGTSGSGINPRELTASSYEVMIGEIPVEAAIQQTQMPFLDIIPSHINLVGAEIEMIDLPDRERVLKKALQSVRYRYDFILIDCPPSLGLLTLNALTASDSVLIPVQAEYFALEGLGQLLNTIKGVRQHLNRDLDIEGVLLTMFDSRLRLANQVAEEVRRYFGEKVFRTIVQRNVRLSEAPSFGVPVLLYDAGSLGTRNYMALAGEVLRNNETFFKSQPPVQPRTAPVESAPRPVSSSGRGMSDLPIPGPSPEPTVIPSTYPRSERQAPLPEGAVLASRANRELSGRPSDL